MPRGKNCYRYDEGEDEFSREFMRRENIRHGDNEELGRLRLVYGTKIDTLHGCYEVLESRFEVLGPIHRIDSRNPVMDEISVLGKRVIEIANENDSPESIEYVANTKKILSLAKRIVNRTASRKEMARHMNGKKIKASPRKKKDPKIVHIFPSDYDKLESGWRESFLDAGLVYGGGGI